MLPHLTQKKPFTYKILISDNQIQNIIKNKMHACCVKQSWYYFKMAFLIYWQCSGPRKMLSKLPRNTPSPATVAFSKLATWACPPLDYNLSMKRSNITFQMKPGSPIMFKIFTGLTLPCTPNFLPWQFLIFSIALTAFFITDNLFILSIDDHFLLY